MSTHVEHAAMMRCQFGTNTAELAVTGPLPIATVRDFVPFENIRPFGACICPANPAVASAMAAAGGVMVPVPCVPAVDEPWHSGTTRILVHGISGLGPDATTRCRWGGVIQLVVPTEAKTHG
jgi:hypothetical protein